MPWRPPPSCAPGGPAEWREKESERVSRLSLRVTKWSVRHYVTTTTNVTSSSYRYSRSDLVPVRTLCHSFADL